MVMVKEVYVLLGAVRFILELWPLEWLSLCLDLLGRWLVPQVGTARSTNWLFSLCLDLCGSLVGTLSGLCPVCKDVIMGPQFVI